MEQSVNIPVEVDTRKAKASLRQLNRDKAKAQKRVSSAAKRTSRMALRAFAFAGGTAAVGKFRGEATSGNVSPIEEALTPYIAAAQQVIDDGLGFSAKARQDAREETKAAFRYHVGRTGETAGMQDFYNTVSEIRENVESGRNILRRDPRFLGPSLDAVVEKGAAGAAQVFLENINASNPIIQLNRGIAYVVEGLLAE